MNKKSNEDRFCEECLSLLVRKKKEPLYHFLRRRFCNIKCVHKNNTEELSDKMPCNICTNILPLEAFHRRSGKPRGVDYTCKECLKQRNSLRRYLPDNSITKTCRICKIERPSLEFFKNSKNKSGRENHCKYCENKRKLKILHNNPETRMRENMRARVRSALKGLNKSKSTMRLIGCTIEELKKHLEDKFLEGMSWDNYGKWHIDHIIPCSSFDLSKEESQNECFGYKNLRPLWAKDNLIKGAKIE